MQNFFYKKKRRKKKKKKKRKALYLRFWQEEIIFFSSGRVKVEFGVFRIFIISTLYFETWSSVRFKMKFFEIRFWNWMLRCFEIRCFGKLLLESPDGALRNNYNRTCGKSLMKMFCQMQWELVIAQTIRLRDMYRCGPRLGTKRITRCITWSWQLGYVL